MKRLGLLVVVAVTVGCATTQAHLATPQGTSPELMERCRRVATSTRTVGTLGLLAQTIIGLGAGIATGGTAGPESLTTTYESFDSDAYARCLKEPATAP